MPRRPDVHPRQAPAERRPRTWRAKRGRPVLARQEEYRLRYKVERSFAWLGNYRRLLIRWERLCIVYEAFFTVAIMLVCLRRRTQAQDARSAEPADGHAAHTARREARSAQSPRA
jgi:transposase